MSIGPCRGNFIRWYYDTDTRRCRMFTYGGCRGNANRFDSAQQCRRICGQNRQRPDVNVDATSASTTNSLPGKSCLMFANNDVMDSKFDLIRIAYRFCYDVIMPTYIFSMCVIRMAGLA